jgi:hypothetical protein
MRTFDNYVKNILEATDPQADTGKYITRDNMKQIYMTLQVILSDTKAGMTLKDLMEKYGKLYFEYSNSKSEALSCQKRYDNLPNKDSTLATELLERIEHFKKISEKAKTQLDMVSPKYLKQLDILIKKSCENFVASTQQKQTFKSFDDLKSKVTGEDADQVIMFLKDVYRGGDSFKPLNNFIVAERGEGKNPMNRLVTMYKTAADIASKRGFIGNPDAVLNSLIGASHNVKAFVEPTAGAIKLKEADPILAEIIKLIKLHTKNPSSLDKALQLVTKTSLSEEEKAKLGADINNLKVHPDEPGLEAKIIQPLYRR